MLEGIEEGRSSVRFCKSIDSFPAGEEEGGEGGSRINDGSKETAQAWRRRLSTAVDIMHAFACRVWKREMTMMSNMRRGEEGDWREEGSRLQFPKFPQASSSPSPFSLLFPMRIHQQGRREGRAEGIVRSFRFSSTCVAADSMQNGFEPPSSSLRSTEH